MSKRYLSGIQPSGIPHLGNYFGAIKQHIKQSQELTKDDSALFFIADFHALTSFNEESKIGKQSHDVAATYMALGLDTKQAIFFRQSDIPEVCELSWMLSCCTGMGLLQRAHSYKDKISKGLIPNVGLFTYPILMAADILIYQTTHVPVGQDQIQHVEMAKDMASSFNHLIGNGINILKHPIPVMSSTPKIPGTDGQKMSKSYGNTISIFAQGADLKRGIKAIQTDSRSPEEPKDPDELPLFNILRCFLSKDEERTISNLIKQGGSHAPRYGMLKAMLKDAIENEFGNARERYNYYLNDSNGCREVADALRDGGIRARKLAKETLGQCYEAIGMTSAKIRQI